MIEDEHTRVNSKNRQAKPYRTAHGVSLSHVSLSRHRSDRGIQLLHYNIMQCIEPVVHGVNVLVFESVDGMIHDR